jgi:phosphoribosylaminoimidazole-succinocarboxamide synthase
MGDLVPHHVIATSVADYPAPLQKYAATLQGRSMLCRRTRPLPIECVARGYLSGSGWKEYQQNGSVCGVKLPAGLRESDRLPEPIFTPATKADLGEHDENVSYDAVVDTVGIDTAEQLRNLTLGIYAFAVELAATRGIILADTKFEFGRDPATGRLVLADEVLTPDSSRFWPADEWRPGQPQPSFDKQYVRNWLLSPKSGWDRSSGEAPPPLPPDVVAATRERYVEAYERLTGLSFDDWAG